MSKNTLRQILVFVAAIATIVVGILANALPINNLTTGEIAARFDGLLVPASYVFSIWGLIYLGLAAYAIYQAQPSLRDDAQLRSLDYPFVVSSAANISWLLLWHYEQYVASVVVILVLLVSLVRIYLRLDRPRDEAPDSQPTLARRLAVDTLFRGYTGWITVATLANLSVVLEYVGWHSWGPHPAAWFLLAALIVITIAAIVAWTRADLAYLLVLVWAFFGLGIKHANEPLLAPIAWSATAMLAALVVLSFVWSRRVQQRDAASS